MYHDKLWYQDYILQNLYNDNRVIKRTDRKNSSGSLDKDGYVIIKVKGHQFKAHRIAWLLEYGEFPKFEIDHINHDRQDNRIENLRLADRKIQVINRKGKANPQTGVKGIYFDKTTKGLRAKFSFHFNNKTYRFRDLADAVEMRRKLRKEALDEHLRKIAQSTERTEGSKESS